MKRSFASIAVFLAIFSLTALPHLVFGQSPPPNSSLIVCGTENAGDHACGWTDLVTLAQHVINFCIYLAIPLAALSFAWAGFLILTAGGDSGKIKTAKTVVVKVGWGLFWVIAGWLVVHTILVVLLGSNAANYSLLK